LFTYSAGYPLPSHGRMVITTALLLLAAMPESGAVAHSRATAQIVAAEEIDFAEPVAESDGRIALLRLIRSRDAAEYPEGAGELRLVEFQ
jgi:hypothetical protein